jgi:hypothetical protein
MAEKDLSVLPVKDPDNIKMYDEKWDNLDPRLPKPPFVFVFNAGVASGKTTTMMNLIYNPNFYRGLFDSIVIISPTIENDLTWKTALEDETVTVITGDQLEKADDIVDAIFQVKVKEMAEIEQEGLIPKQTLLILDDCLGLLGKKFARMITRHRHPRISVMVSTQDFRSIPIQCRQNASHYLIYRTQNHKELGKLVEEFGSIYGVQNFEDCFRECTKEKYHFMFLHQRDRKIYKDFDTLLYDGNEKTQW